MLGDRTFNRTSITKNGRSINGSIIPIATVIGMVSMIDEGARLSLGCRFITISS